MLFVNTTQRLKSQNEEKRREKIRRGRKGKIINFSHAKVGKEKTSTRHVRHKHFSSFCSSDFVLSFQSRRRNGNESLKVQMKCKSLMDPSSDPPERKKEKLFC